MDRTFESPFVLFICVLKILIQCIILEGDQFSFYDMIPPAWRELSHHRMIFLQALESLGKLLRKYSIK